MENVFFAKGLPKWPGLLVVGEKITPSQAQEILIRTNGFPVFGNDREFEKLVNQVMYGEYVPHHELYEVMGAKSNQPDAFSKYNSLNKYHEELNLLTLNYLSNHRVLSAWVGGPYGWCDWEGHIYSSSFNIGKYPEVEEVFNDWVDIATAFPFLNLKCQILNDEIGSKSEEIPVVEFVVKNGIVEMVEPTSLITKPRNVIEDMFTYVPKNNNTSGITDLEIPFMNNEHERGCTIEKFTEAISFVRKKFNSKLLKEKN